MKLYRFVCALGLTAGAACGREVQNEVRHAGPAHCVSRSEGSRWSSGTGNYVPTTEYGRRGGEEWLYDVGGLASSPAGVVVYDAGRARVVVLDTLLRPVRWFGREGKGPGEFTPFRDMSMRGDQWKWLDSAGDSILVYDGDRIQTFTTDGRFVAQRWSRLTQDGTITPAMPRLRYVANQLITSSGGYQDSWTRSGRDAYTWSLHARTGDAGRQLGRLHLAALPKPNGVPFNGPAQARPLWDVGGGCVALADGTGQSMVRASLDGGGVDTLPLDLSAIPVPQVNEAEIERLLGESGRGRAGRYSGPSAVKRLVGLIVDPDGTAWLLPAQDSAHLGTDVEVIRVALATGAAQRDTVPAFPTLFGSPGVYYARQRNRRTEETVIVRYNLVTRQPPRTQSPRP